MTSRRNSLILASLALLALVIGACYLVVFPDIYARTETVQISLTTTCVQYDNNDCPTQAFEPRSLTVTEGEHVTIVFYNNDDVPHQLVIRQFNVSTGIVRPGQTSTATFVPDEVGDFTFNEPLGSCCIGPIPEIPPGGCCGVEHNNGTLTVLAR
jgi:plastocyanin